MTGKLSETQEAFLGYLGQTGKCKQTLRFGCGHAIRLHGPKGWSRITSTTLCSLYKQGLISMDINENWVATFKLTEEGEAVLDKLNG